MSDDSFIKFMDLIERMAEASKATVDTVFKIVRIEKRATQEERDERRSSPTEKETIRTKMGQWFRDDPTRFDGTNPKELCEQLGVRVNQGNRSRIRHYMVQLRLEYQRSLQKQPAE